MEASFFLAHWAELLIAAMAFAKVVVNLTPTEQDNAVFGLLDKIVTAVTGDRRKRGK
jgi:hypothetical protein|tara:strand:- start:7271 stop:7441 length:171 start_codon:yes stop_codon:yes gene_type:complete